MGKNYLPKGYTLQGHNLSIAREAKSDIINEENYKNKSNHESKAV